MILRYWKKMLGIVVILGILLIAGLVALYFYNNSLSDSNNHIREWLDTPTARPALITYRERCGDAPFILPSDGFIGLLWGDTALPYNLLNRHTGLDIFGDGQPNEVPVYAVYDGYLTRLSDWFSTVIIEHDDPLHTGEKIWSYYTHMGSEDGAQSFVAEAFPPGTARVWVEQGTLLGYQGEYNGNRFGIALHVHISLVKSDAEGNFLNESQLDNTLDPSPYFGLPLNIKDKPERPIQCP